MRARTLAPLARRPGPVGPFAALLAFATLGFAGCGTEQGDPPATPVVGDIREGFRIRDVSDPTLPNHPAPNSTVVVRGAVVVAVDTHDETQDGRTRGSIYVQDIGSTEPYSGIGLYQPTFVPGNLRLSPGDVLDLSGVYQENPNIGTANFPTGHVLPQLAQPVGTFRYEAVPPTPRDIDVKELGEYETGRAYIGMLVRVTNVTLSNPRSNSGRVTSDMFESPNAAQMSNELMPIRQADYPAGTVLAELSGVVTYFGFKDPRSGDESFHFKIAPRSAADIVRR